MSAAGLRRGLLILPVVALAAAGVRAAPDDSFLDAREAFRSGDAARLERDAQNLNGYVLEPYVAYWRLRLRLDAAAPDDVRALLARLKDSPLADRLRADWLKRLGAQQQWDLFDAEYPRYNGADPEIVCDALQSRLRGDVDDALHGARALWFTGRELPDACDTLFEALDAVGALSADDIRARIRLALAAGNTGVARRASEFLPPGERLDAGTLSYVAVSAQRYLDRGKFNLDTRAGRETAMFAVYRLARIAPPLAAQRWERIGARFSDEERGYVWGLIALYGAQRLDPGALEWYRRAGTLSDEQLVWKARSALHAQRWPEVLAAINAMSEPQARDPAWRYWKARALTAAGRAGEAKVLLLSLAADPDFYGQLAAEDLGARSAFAPPAYRPDDNQVRAVGDMPGIQRALAFYRLNLRYEGNLEWNWAMRDLDDRQLLAAAEFARRRDLYDRAIYAAERTRQLHDFNMRYPAPYRDLLRDYASQQQLDEAWLYALIRQESRFVPEAHSSAGAGGLMQLMPATARWIAKRLGVRSYHRTQMTDVEINLNFGTWYLRHVLDELDNQPLLASAAYNAGPRHAREWRSDVPMEGAIYAESIPITETRDYVKKVMSGAVYYGQQIGFTLRSLKDRLGVIVPPQSNAEPQLDEPL
ncbi:MAG TPA: transglycosylase SLT domain-containing protein [Burkholderiales bacterium]|nr:transglycosylase SLT domain-containing protein [Burkholderiales bacterium]